MQQGSVTLPSMPAVFVPGGKREWNNVNHMNGKPSQTTSEATTICFKNIPNSYTRKMISELFDTNGFKGMYDFIYVPHDFTRLPALANLGYFFVNFTSHECALRAWEKFVGFKEWLTESDKVMAATWASTTQGKTACIERFQNSPVMHEHVPPECKPVLIENNTVVHLTPTKKFIKRPRLKHDFAYKLTLCCEDAGRIAKIPFFCGAYAKAAFYIKHEVDNFLEQVCSDSSENGTATVEQLDTQKMGSMDSTSTLADSDSDGDSDGSSASDEPSVKTDVRLQAVLQTFALRCTGQLFEVKNTFIDLKLPPSECLKKRRRSVS